VDAIALLMDEHQLILRALDALDAFAGKLARGGEDKAELTRFVAFIRDFADARHHGKEEDILFEAMIGAGFPRQAGPIAVMLMEHDEGRGRLAVMRELAAQAAPWTDADRARLGEAAHGYTSLLRGHIEKEDSILYPMAQARLPPEVLERVDASCEAFEARHAGEGGTDALRRLGADLVARHPAVR